MQYNEIFPSKYAASTDLQGGPVKVQISRVEVEEIGRDEERKPVVHFTNRLKPLICNKTNFRTIAALYGDDTDHWIGQTITLVAVQVEFSGDVVQAIRVKPASKASTPIRKPVQRPIEDDLDDKIPDFDGPPDPPPADEDGNPLQS